MSRSIVYPLLKATDLAGRRVRPRPKSARFIVTQRQSRREETRGPWSSVAPRLWAYLMAHSDRLRADENPRYTGGGLPFSLFGIGDYSFAPVQGRRSRGCTRSPGSGLVEPFGWSTGDARRYRVIFSHAGPPSQATLLRPSPRPVNGTAALGFLGIAADAFSGRQTARSPRRCFSGS